MHGAVMFHVKRRVQGRSVRPQKREHNAEARRKSRARRTSVTTACPPAGEPSQRRRSTDRHVPPRPEVKSVLVSRETSRECRRLSAGPRRLRGWGEVAPPPTGRSDDSAPLRRVDEHRCTPPVRAPPQHRLAARVHAHVVTDVVRRTRRCRTSAPGARDPSGTYFAGAGHPAELPSLTPARADVHDRDTEGGRSAANLRSSGLKTDLPRIAGSPGESLSHN